MSQLVGIGTETFESQFGSVPLNLVFPGAGTATLSGSGAVTTLANAATSNGVGRYGITRDGGTESYLEINGGGSFLVSFSAPVAAFGFYGTDVGDFGAQLQLNVQFSGGGSSLIAIPHTRGGNDGSVFFYGLISTAPTEQISSIGFSTPGNAADFLGFDDMTIGSLQQVRGLPDGGSTIALLGLALAGIAGYRRKSKV